MKITHHLDDATLMSCSAGSQPEALAAVVSSHLSVCPRCRLELKRHALIGEVLFEALKPEPVSGEVPQAGARAETISAPADDGGLPAALQAALHGRFDDVPWRRAAPGVWHCPIELSPGAKGDLRLLKVAPGIKLPEHGHGGSELTLVLDGAYSDEFGTFRRGDVADLGDDVEHRPVADPEHGCICLAASDARPRFKGMFARLLQPLAGL
ncbi:MAG: ChrR family anti-sigma-E factor [Hyphomicrobium sp.]|jgi:putative transcriptional regulator|nr:ChrR family anti-sigma-E factor [Hyphomicrobium sp.]